MNAAIRILSESTINQIAAGEVIESPASVVKELVENSIDAGATLICIEIIGGGLQLIRVSDDGIGMGQDDLLLCLERHATSKIRESKDLLSLSSMGFRGEALASITAISKTSIESSIFKEGLGGKIVAEAGQIKRIEDIVRKRGTTVEVRSLFYNVPARKKFQKSAAACQMEIFKIVTKLALASPEVCFRLFANEKELFFSDPPQGKSRMEIVRAVATHVLGPKFVYDASPVESKKELCSLSGYLGAPFAHRPNRIGQYLIVNGRPVFCPEVCQAIADGYGTALPNHRHPTFVLYLDLPIKWVDVNVHPQKREIRLREVEKVREFIRKSVLKGLQRNKEKPFFSVQNSAALFALKTSPPFPQEKECMLLKEEKREEKPPSLFPNPEDYVDIGFFPPYLILDASTLTDRLSFLQKEEECDGLLIVDIAAAEARIIFEKFLHQNRKKNELQGLLFPITLEFSPQEAAKLALYFDDIYRLGIAARAFGTNCVIIDALDPLIDETKVESFLKELLLLLISFQDKEALMKERQKKLATLALRYAKSQRKHFSLVEAKKIFQKLLQAENPYYCPKGKKVIAYVSRHELEKHFS